MDSIQARLRSLNIVSIITYIISTIGLITACILIYGMDMTADSKPVYVVIWITGFSMIVSFLTTSMRRRLVKKYK